MRGGWCGCRLRLTRGSRTCRFVESPAGVLGAAISILHCEPETEIKTLRLAQCHLLDRGSARRSRNDRARLLKLQSIFSSALNDRDGKKAMSRNGAQEPAKPAGSAHRLR